MSSDLLLSGLSAVSGALIGAATALASVWLAAKRQERLEERRWSIEAKTRFHDLRRQLYAEFLSLASSVGLRVGELALYRNASEEVRSRPRFVQLSEQLAGQMARLRILGDEINLIATEPVRKQVALIHLTIVSWELHDLLGLDSEEVRQQTATLRSEYLPQFVAAARIELGIPAT